MSLAAGQMLPVAEQQVAGAPPCGGVRARSGTMAPMLRPARAMVARPFRRESSLELVASPLSVLLRERLETVLAPHVAVETVLRALESHTTAQLPRSADEMVLFLSTALRAELALRVGVDVADGVLRDLFSILRDVVAGTAGHRESGARLCAGREQTASTTLPAPFGDLRFVRLVTPHPPTLERLRERLEGVGCACVTGDAEPADDLGPPPSARPILVLDCRMPCSEISAAASAALRSEGRETVLLWGTQEDVCATLGDLPHVPEHWVRCGAMSPLDLAMFCLVVDS